MNSIIQERLALLKGNSMTDSLALECARGIIGPSVDLNASSPRIYPYLYQVCKLGSLMNKGLRNDGVPSKQRLSSFLYQIYTSMMYTMSQLSPINREVVVFRGIPAQDLPVYHVGDIITDLAFNSTSLDPTVAEFFGDCILVIRLRPEDKLWYINGSTHFFPDTFECILSPGMCYQIVSIQSGYISKRPVTFYIVDSLGPVEASPMNIDIDFDVSFCHLMKSLVGPMGQNMHTSSKDWTCMLYYGEKESWVEIQLPLGITMIDESFFVDFMRSIDERASMILEYTDLYIRLFDREIKAIYLVPRAKVQLVGTDTLPPDQVPLFRTYY